MYIANTTKNTFNKLPRKTHLIDPTDFSTARIYMK